MRKILFVLGLLHAAFVSADECIDYGHGIQELERVALPGTGNAMAGLGDHLYIGTPSGLRIYEIDAVEMPRVVGEILMGEDIEQVACFDGRLLVVHELAGDDLLSVFDLAEPESPGMIASGSVVDRWKLREAVSDRIWLSRGGTNGFPFDLIELNIEAEGTIELVMETDWPYKFMSLQYPHLYAVEMGIDQWGYGQRLIAIDISDPALPFTADSSLWTAWDIDSFHSDGEHGLIVWSYRYSGNDFKAGYLKGGTVWGDTAPGVIEFRTRTAQFLDERVFFTGSSWHLGTPLAIAHYEHGLQAELGLPGYSGGFYINGDRWYLLDSSELIVLDCSDPRTPMKLDSDTEPDWFNSFVHCNAMAVRGNLAFAFLRGSLSALDLSDPEDIRYLGSMSCAGTWDVGPPHLAGDLAFATEEDSGEILAFSIQDSTDIECLGKTATSVLTGRLTTAGSWLYASAGEAGILILDRSDPGQLVEVGALTSPGTTKDLCARDELLVGASDRLSIYSLATPEVPLLIGSADLFGQAERIMLRDGLAFVALGEAGLSVLDLSDPAAPSPLSHLDLHIEDFAFDGDMLYGLGNGLFVVDVADPAMPELIGRMNDVERFTQVGIAENCLVFATSVGSDGNDDYIQTFPKQCQESIPVSLRELSMTNTPASITFAWELSGQDLGSLEQRLTAIDAQGRTHRPEIHYLGMGAYRAVDDHAHLALGGNLTYTLEARAPGQGWLPLEIRMVQRAVKATHILDAWPNPFNPTIHLRILQAEQAHVRVDVHDILGRRIRTIQDGVLPAGQADLSWDGKETAGGPAASGIYFLSYKSGELVENMKVVLLR